ncbi:MAG: Ppx/GppA phosphatase [Bryobacterales bacterium]|nr:Ppx/GppA phosphatase [Bryobacterales bacterium]
MSRYAAIDIGSNSIRMLAAEVNSQHSMQVLAADRQVVRLGKTVFLEGRLGPSEIELACQVLARMVEQYRKLDLVSVRVVGTAALRDASNRDEFLARAAAIIGHPIEVISGLEEARLIHLGVQAVWPQTKQRVLMVDIGGGSAELILSEGGRLVEAFSKPLGALRLTEVFLKSDPPNARELARMQKYIQERIAGPVARFGTARVDRMITTSATAAAAVCAVNHVRRSRRDHADRLPATAPQLRQLFREVSSRDSGGRAKITGIGPKRAEIIVAGVAVLNQVVQEMQLSRLYYSTAGVREGIIADLSHRQVGMEQARLNADERRLMRALGRHYGVSAPHVRKVADLAGMLFQGLRPLHRLPLVKGRLLEAAAYLYNIGHFVNESRHHRHSMYLVANSDLPGFEDRERLVIANLCRYHRKSMPQLSHETFQALLPEDRNTIVLLTPLLRLAVALDQSQEQRVDRVEAEMQENVVELRLFSERDVDIEQWQAEQVAGAFREAYGRPLAVRVRR